jgi:hypothetical protein
MGKHGKAIKRNVDDNYLRKEKEKKIIRFMFSVVYGRLRMTTFLLKHFPALRGGH